MVAEEEAVALRQRLSQNATVIHSKDASALDEANQQLLLQPLVKQTPSLLVYVAEENDVLEVLRFCYLRRLRPVLVATGHDWNGRSSGAGAVRIATPRLCWVHVDGDRARVGAGCTWGHIWKELEPLGHIGVGGALGTVSIGGSLQGGGHGGLSRQHGLIADQLLAARVALSNGSGVVVADAHGPHADLFRALRGGGGGTYGAVVEFTIRIHPFPKSYAVSSIALPLRSNGSTPSARDVTERFFHNASWWALVPDSWAGWHEVNTDHDGEKWSGSLAAWLFHWGQDPDEACLSSGCPAAMSEYFHFVGSWPVAASLHMQIQAYLPRRVEATKLKNSFISNTFVSLTDLQDKASNLTDLVINSALDALDRKEVIHWTYNDVLGGQIPTYGPETVISSGFRSAIFEICVGKEWPGSNNDQQIQQIMPVVEQLYKLRLGSDMSYYNEVTHWSGLHEINDWRQRFWGSENYDFLHRVKSTYDPCNILWVDRGVGSEDPKMTC
ncbi:OXR2 [Symbiodinium natans]|uniref:OXR2 protein n=1 Tax=Symbiodinium natans TaxID=878477 RepID=A0A812NFN0_9DINO|nr:OXR2 [Symbiodinium natans]